MLLSERHVLRLDLPSRMRHVPPQHLLPCLSTHAVFLSFFLPSTSSRIAAIPNTAVKNQTPSGNDMRPPFQLNSLPHQVTILLSSQMRGLSVLN